jgi:hypothetical protein
MSAFGEAPETEPPSADPVTIRLDEILDELLDELVAVVADTTPVRDAARIDRIARLEKLRAATAALQTAESVRFAQSQVAEQLAANVHPDAIGRGIAEQIGLACRISPVVAARRLNTARALWFELPDTYAQLTSGELSDTSTRKSAATSTSNLKLPASPGWDSRPLPHAPARPPIRPIHTATSNAAVPNANTAASVSDPHPTPWQC